MNNSAIELVPAVIYARFSSSGQREESIIGQHGGGNHYGINGRE